MRSGDQHARTYVGKVHRHFISAHVSRHERLLLLKQHVVHVAEELGAVVHKHIELCTLDVLDHEALILAELERGACDLSQRDIQPQR